MCDSLSLSVLILNITVGLFSQNILTQYRITIRHRALRGRSAERYIIVGAVLKHPSYALIIHYHLNRRSTGIYFLWHNLRTGEQREFKVVDRGILFIFYFLFFPRLPWQSYSTCSRAEQRMGRSFFFCLYAARPSDTNKHSGFNSDKAAAM